jgi:glycosyltransferase involved in cell wall biosynthesis
MRVAIIHDSLNDFGGAEVLALGLAKALKEMRHHVKLYVRERTNWDRVRRLSPYTCDVVDCEYVLPPYKTKLLPSTYENVLTWILRDVINFNLIIKNKGYDVTIITKPSLVPAFADIIYIHFPMFIPVFKSLYYPDKFVYNVVNRILSMPVALIEKLLISLSSILDYKPVVLTNSTFSSLIIRKFLKINPLILHPPVAVERLLPLSVNEKREDIVVTISRIDPSKNLDIIIDVAKKVRSAKFAIIGTLSSYSYYHTLIREIKRNHLGERIKILVNVDEDQKIDVLRRAKVYLHTMKYEHFGIAVVEGMAAGLIPIVHKRGGPWLDIVERGRYGFGFENLDDVVNTIEFILGLDRDTLRELQSSIAERAKAFSFDNFKLKASKIIEKVALTKND